MATYSAIGVLDHTSDAGFRNWITDFTTGLSSIGLQQTADTGQLTTASITRPGTNTAGGYQVYQFSDSLQSSYPLYMKIEFGTGNITSIPTMWITIGNATNGSGSITGTTYVSRTTIGTTTTIPSSTATSYPSYFCYNTSTGFLGWGFKSGSSANSTISAAAIGRSCDATGTLTTSGATAILASTNGAANSRQFAFTYGGSTIINGVVGKYSIVVGAVSSSAVGSDLQAYPNWTAYPRVEPINWRCTVILANLPAATTFTTTLVGSVPHTYISLGASLAYGDDASNNAAYGGAILWE